MSNIELLREVLQKMGLNGHELDWEVVMICLRLKGLTLQRAAINAGLGTTTMPHVKFRHMPRYERALAAALGLSPEQLWPSRYEKRDINLLASEEVSP